MMKKIHSAKFESYVLIAICFLTYVFTQITKSAVGANATALMNEYNETHANVGLISSAFMIAYGFGQILLSPFCLKINKVVTVSVAITTSMICSFVAFFKIPFVVYYIIWLINGLSHAPLWMLIIQTLNEKLSKKYITKAGFFMAISSLGGALLSYVVCSIFSKINFYKGSFLVAGIGLLISLLIWVIYNIVKPTIQKEELTEEDAKEIVEDNELNGSKASSIVLLFFFGLLVALAYGVSAGLKSWLPNMLKEMYSLEDWFTILLSLLLPFCAIFNSAISIKAYQKYKNFNIVCIIFFALSLALTLTLYFVFKIHWAFAFVLFILLNVTCGVITCSLTVNAPLCLANQHFNSGQIAGLLNGAAYLGAALLSYILGAIADGQTWNGVFIFFVVIIAIALALSVGYEIAIVIIKKKKVQ